MAQPEPADIRMERMLEAHVTKNLRWQLDRLLQRVSGYYIRLAGSLDNPLPASQRDRFLRWLVEEILEITPNSQPRLEQAAAMATAFGIDTATEALPGIDPPQVQLTDRLLTSILHTDMKARGDILDAAQYAQQIQPTTWNDTLAVIAKTNRAGNRTAATTRHLANEAMNLGVTAVADQLDAPRVWVPEKDACLTCLAYAGRVVGPGEWFPAGLTFGDHSTVKQPIRTPPAHPNCRCRTQLWLGQDDDGGPVTFPEGLRREALRAVLRGASGYDSTPAQLRAVDRLLVQGVAGMPKSVLDRARRDLARRQFSRRGQTVRTGTLVR